MMRSRRVQQLVRRSSSLSGVGKCCRPSLVGLGPSSAEYCQHRRTFASSPSSELPSGLEEVLATLSKVRARRHVFQQYKKQQLFAPTCMSWLANWMMFYHLNRPQQTQLDLSEFMEGAKFAMDATMTAMYSKEFTDYVVREEAAPGALPPDCAAAELVERSLEQVSYDAFKAFVSQSLSVGIRAEMQEIEIHAAHLLSVQYDRVPRRSSTNASGAKVLVPSDERLKLAVLFDITEHVNVTLPGEGSEELTVRRNKAIWQFASNVTTPQDIDWVIEPLHLVA